MIRKQLRNLLNKFLRNKKIKRLIQIINKVLEENRLLQVTEPLLGLHGDQYLLNLVNFLLLESQYFIETGSRRGVTLKYVADGYKKLKLLSCEPNREFFSIAESKLKGYDNCKLFNETSQIFLPKILDTYDLNENMSFFFLDAHGKGFKWPLREEIEQITHRLKRAIILIDDFKVPNNPQFIYDSYEGQKCSMSYIRDKFNSRRDYLIIYPKYKVKTSNYLHFPGFVVILMGLSIKEINIPFQLFENYNLISLKKGVL